LVAAALLKPGEVTGEQQRLDVGYPLGVASCDDLASESKAPNLVQAFQPGAAVAQS
jgi:hypothetical protein